MSDLGPFVRYQRVPNMDAYEMFIFKYTSDNRTIALLGGKDGNMINLAEEEMIPPALILPGNWMYGGLKDQLADLFGPSSDAASTLVLREWLDREKDVNDEYRRS